MIVLKRRQMWVKIFNMTRAGERAQWVKILVAKANNLSSNPES